MITPEQHRWSELRAHVSNVDAWLKSLKVSDFPASRWVHSEFVAEIVDALNDAGWQATISADVHSEDGSTYIEVSYPEGGAA